MGILGIDNRTENWKTVQHFHGLSDGAKVALARRLGEPKDTAAEEIGMELFWHPMRDYHFQHGKRVEPGDLVRIYGDHFSDLAQKIRDFDGFRKLTDKNYMMPSDPKGLYDNVMNTEVDVVLETRDSLFIGEAKFESDLGTGSSVLVHQLIRQYVTVKILVDLAERRQKCVIPFVVTEAGPDEKKLESMKNTDQVKFMIDQKWLREDNVLSWGDVNDIRLGLR